MLNDSRQKPLKKNEPSQRGFSRCGVLGGSYSASSPKKFKLILTPRHKIGLETPQTGIERTFLQCGPTENGSLASNRILLLTPGIFPTIDNRNILLPLRTFSRLSQSPPGKSGCFSIATFRPQPGGQKSSGGGGMRISTSSARNTVSAHERLKTGPCSMTGFLCLLIFMRACGGFGRTENGRTIPGCGPWNIPGLVTKNLSRREDDSWLKSAKGQGSPILGITPCGDTWLQSLRTPTRSAQKQFSESLDIRHWLPRKNTSTTSIPTSSPPWTCSQKKTPQTHYTRQEKRKNQKRAKCLISFWRPQRDSNSCRRRERPVSIFPSVFKTNLKSTISTASIRSLVYIFVYFPPILHHSPGKTPQNTPRRGHGSD